MDWSKLETENKQYSRKRWKGMMIKGGQLEYQVFRKISN